MSFEKREDPLNDNRFECLIAEYMKRFTRLLHIFFCIALAMTVIATLAIFFSDMLHIFTTGNISTGTIHALGSLLILWTLSELIQQEIRNLQGERIKVTIFVEVAIAAMIRKLLINATEGMPLEDISVYLASLLVLGLVYWFLTPKIVRPQSLKR